MSSRMLASTLALLVVLATMSPALAAAQTDDGSLGLSVVQAPSNGQVTLEVTGEGIEDETASVNITSNTSYPGNGTYDVALNGSIDLPAPDDHVEIYVTAEAGEESANETFQLVPYEDSLSIDVIQHDDRSATVTVTQYGTPVEGASVDVTANRSYAGNGSYTTNGEGNVSLLAPEHAVNISVTATSGDLVASTHAVLRGPHVSLSVGQTAEGNVSIEVTFNDSHVNASVDVSGEYGGTGSYTTGDDGELLLPAPTHNTTITVTATYKDDSATTTANLTVSSDETEANDFAESLVAFIHMLQGMDVDGPLGQRIAEFVHEHNPASADDDAGPPAHAGPPEDDADGEGDDGGEDSSETGTAETDDADDHGPPEHAGPPGDDADSKDDSQRGPPDHAGPDDDSDDEEDSDDGDNESESENESDENGSEQDEQSDEGNSAEEDSNEEESDGDGEGDEDEDEDESDDAEESSSGDDSPGNGNGHGPPDHAGED